MRIRHFTDKKSEAKKSKKKNSPKVTWLASCITWTEFIVASPGKLIFIFKVEKLYVSAQAIINQMN